MVLFFVVSPFIFVPHVSITDWVLDICLRRENRKGKEDERKMGGRKGEAVSSIDRIRERKNCGRIFRVPFIIRMLKDYIFKS